MALLFYDGFDWAGDTSVEVNSKWTGPVEATNSLVAGRFGGKAVLISTSSGTLNYVFSTSKNTIYTGIAMYQNGVPVFSLSYPFMVFHSGSSIHVKFHFKNNTTAAFYNGSGTQIGNDITIPSFNGRWSYFEFKVTISDTVGEIIFRMNGVEYYNGTNLDTCNGTPTDINNVSWKYINGAGPCYYDDVYIDDSQFHGDVRVRTIYPDANGSENDFTPSENSNYQNVDDPGDQDDDTTYNSANTLGDRDLYGVTAPTLAIVKAVAVNNSIRKDDAGDREVKNVVRSGGSNYLGNTFILGANYLVSQSIWETDPQDSQVWTKEKIDAAEFGLEITA